MLPLTAAGPMNSSMGLFEHIKEAVKQAESRLG